MKTFMTVHAVAMTKDDKVLILQRAAERSSPGTWSCVTGHVHDRESAEEAAARELEEETGLSGKLIRTSEPFWLDEKERRFVIVSSLFLVENAAGLKIDKTESQAYRWVDLKDPLVAGSRGLMESLKHLDIV